MPPPSPRRPAKCRYSPPWRRWSAASTGRHDYADHPPPGAECALETTCRTMPRCWRSRCLGRVPHRRATARPSQRRSISANASAPDDHWPAMPPAWFYDYARANPHSARHAHVAASQASTIFSYRKRYDAEAKSPSLRARQSEKMSPLEMPPSNIGAGAWRRALAERQLAQRDEVIEKRCRIAGGTCRDYAATRRFRRHDSSCAGAASERRLALSTARVGARARCIEIAARCWCADYGAAERQAMMLFARRRRHQTRTPMMAPREPANACRLPTMPSCRRAAQI